MKNPVGFSLAIAATASLAIAGGDGDDKDKKAKNSSALAALGSQPGPQAAGTTITAAPGEGFTVSVGDEFSVNVSAGVQARWTFADFDNNVPDTNNFSIPRARARASGHVWDKSMTYLLQVGDDGGLLDAWFRWAFWSKDDNSIALRFGQQKAHHGKEAQIAYSNLEFIDRSLASQTFSTNRVVGAFLQGSHLEGSKLNWNAGVANSDPAGSSFAAESGNGAANVDNEVNYFFDVRVDPWGDMGDEGYVEGDLSHTEEIKGTIGGSVMIGNLRDLANTVDIEATSINLYTGWKYHGFHALGEVFIRTDDPDVAGGVESDSTGWSVGGTYTLAPQEGKHSQWGFGVRYSMVDYDDPPIVLGLPIGAAGVIPAAQVTAATGDVTEIQGVVSNYYHAHKLKTQIGFTHQTVSPTGGIDSDNEIVDIQFQWLF